MENLVFLLKVTHIPRNLKTRYAEGEEESSYKKSWFLSFELKVPSSSELELLE